jgi:alanine dehydrogenase
MVHGVVHYCVANMPGAVAHTSTWALTNTTIGPALAIADLGIGPAAQGTRALALGINTFGGHITHPSVAAAHRLDYVPLERALG